MQAIITTQGVAVPINTVVVLPKVHPAEATVVLLRVLQVAVMADPLVFIVHLHLLNDQLNNKKSFFIFIGNAGAAAAAAVFQSKQRYI